MEQLFGDWGKVMISLSEPQAWSLAIGGAVMIIDVVSGLVKAFAKKCYDSAKMRVGLVHKFTELVIVALAFVLELACEHIAGLPFSGVTVVLTCAYIIIMEVGSIMENLIAAYPELADTPLAKLFAEHKED